MESTEVFNHECQEGKTPVFTEYCQENRIIGVLCLSCLTEWLLTEIIQANDNEETVIYKNEKYILHKPKTDEIPLSRDFQAQDVKPGDHIVWFCDPLFLLQGIVVAIDDEKLELIRLKYQNDGSAVFDKEQLDIKSNNISFSKIEYNEEVNKTNPPELVLERCKALRTRSDLAIHNCENFAVFCKSGINEKRESLWFVDAMKEVLTHIWEAANFMFVSTMLKTGFMEILKLEAELREKVYRTADEIDTGMMVTCEEGLCIFDLGPLYRKTATSDKSRTKFIEETMKTIADHFFSTLDKPSKILTTAGILQCPSIKNPEVSAAVVGIVSGRIGSNLNEIITNEMEKFVFKPKCIPTTASEVTRLSDIQPGDHIYFYGSLYHPNCHGVVIKVFADDNVIIYVRHVYGKGVILETFYYTGYEPIYKVYYPETIDRYTGPQIVNRAIKAVAENDQSKYAVVRNRCKQFVYNITLKDYMGTCA